MFLNLNIRNRRQKLLHNLSFESEFYDVYDPNFTSEDEEEDSNASSSGTIVEEDDPLSEDIEGDSCYKSSSSDTTNSENAEECSTKLNPKDLEYNSENNRSSLSSIHREIQEAPTTIIDQQQDSVLKPQNLIVAHSSGRNRRKTIDMETGGCQVEEMQNDTVMNKCGHMFT